MTIKKKSFLSFLLLTAIALSSCKKEATESSAEPSEAKLEIADITSQDGRLIFKSEQQFTEMMKKSREENSLELIEKITSELSRKNKFISLRTMANSERTENVLIPAKMSSGDIYYPPAPPVIIGGGGGGLIPQPPSLVAIDSLVEDPYFASVLSPTGEIQVENTIYKVTEDGTFMCDSLDKPVLDALIAELKAAPMIGAINNIIEPTPHKSFFGVINWPRIFFMDTFGKNQTTPPPPPVSTIIEFKTGANIFNDVLSFDFNDAKTWAGKLLQGLFGRDQFNYFKRSEERRLKVNFYSKNFLIYASAGVKAVIQKKRLIGWSELENFGEMRLGWYNMVINLDVPIIENPTNVPPKDFWNAANNALKSNINFKFNNTGKEWLIYRVSDILEFNKYKGVLPLDLTAKLNKLIEKTNNVPLDGAALLESQLDKQGIERLIGILKQIVSDKTKGVAITTARDNSAITHLMVPSDEEIRQGSSKGASMDKLFDMQTAIVGIKNGEPIFKPAKTIQIISGSTYGLGTIDNSEWIGVVVNKK